VVKRTVPGMMHQGRFYPITQAPENLDLREGRFLMANGVIDKKGNLVIHTGNSVPSWNRIAKLTISGLALIYVFLKCLQNLKFTFPLQWREHA